MKKLKNTRGTTLAELMVVVAMVGIMASIGPSIFQGIVRMWKITDARTSVQRDARITLTLIEGLLKQASANSLTLTRQDAAQPPYSKIEFSIPSGDTYHFYQSGSDLWIYHQDPGLITHTRVLAENIRYISFGYPQVSEDTFLSVAICFEQKTVGSESKNFYLSSQKIKVMNT